MIKWYTFTLANILEKALGKGVVPEIFNSDQGCQFTSEASTSRLRTAEVQISRDGRGRFWDNIFIERLWHSIKYEQVYLKDYVNLPDAIGNLDDYFRFHNSQRHHQALGYKTPEYVFFRSSSGKARSADLLPQDRRSSVKTRGYTSIQDGNRRIHGTSISRFS